MYEESARFNSIRNNPLHQLLSLYIGILGFYYPSLGGFFCAHFPMTLWVLLFIFSLLLLGCPLFGCCPDFLRTWTRLRLESFNLLYSFQRG